MKDLKDRIIEKYKELTALYEYRTPPELGLTLRLQIQQLEAELEAGKEKCQYTGDSFQNCPDWQMACTCIE